MIRPDRYVAKFGGTSLANPEPIRKVMAIIGENDFRSLVVVSAPGKRENADTKVTDLLYQLHKANGKKRAQLFKAVCDRFIAIAHGIKININVPLCLSDIEHVQMPRDMTPDFVVSRGEYLMARILATAVGYHFLDATPLIRFNADGSINMKQTALHARQLILPGIGYVIPGFYGSMPNGSVKTFSRGGSDLTGALIAAVVNANLYENWTDKTGMLMAHPDIVQNPKPISHLTYKEVRELSYNGANILHEDVMAIVRKANISIRICNTYASTEPGTFVVPEHLSFFPERKHGSITGVSGRTGFSIVHMSKTLMSNEVGFDGRVGSIFAEHGLSIEHMPDSRDDLSVIVDTKVLRKKQKLLKLHLLEECQPDTMLIEHGFALVCTVGVSMARTPGVAAKVLTAVAAAGVNVRCIIQGASEISITIAVAESDYEKTVRAIYDACA